MRSETITLGGTDYTVGPFTIGQLEEVSDILLGGNVTYRSGSSIVKIALRRADPAVSDPENLPATVEEIMQASRTLLKLAGVEMKAENPPVAERPAA